MFSQRLARPSRQRAQCPHQRDGLTATWSPTVSPGAVAVDLDDLAGDLVAEDQRRGDDEIAGPRMAEIVQVGAADAAGAEAHAHHARRERPERVLR